jgi:hypothetical protein
MSLGVEFAELVQGGCKGIALKRKQAAEADGVLADV